MGERVHEGEGAGIAEVPREDRELTAAAGYRQTNDCRRNYVLRMVYAPSLPLDEDAGSPLALERRAVKLPSSESGTSRTSSVSKNACDPPLPSCRTPLNELDSSQKTTTANSPPQQPTPPSSNPNSARLIPSSPRSASNSGFTPSRTSTSSTGIRGRRNCLRASERR